MKATYQLSLLWFLVAILMMPLAYGQNETILVANFMNGNNAFLNSRVYLFNPTDTAGQITVRVFRLPLLSGFPQELTVVPLSLGSLGAKSAVNIKLAEDILTPLGIALPYINDGGNLTVEFTVAADKVRGVAQVFTDNFAFGTYPLQGPESISGTVPGGEIPDGSVTTIKIADTAVTGAKIANGAVGSAQLADSVIFGASNSPGRIDVVNSNNSRVFFVGDSGGVGLLNMFNSTGTVTTILGNLNNAGALNMSDAGGNVKVNLGVSNNGGQFNLSNSTDNTIVILGNVNNAGQLDLSNTTGNATVILGSLNNDGILNMNDAGGKLKVILSAGNSGGQISVNNTTGMATVILGNISDEGAINVLDAMENLKVFVGVSNNGGRLAVTNSSNVTTAGIEGSTGLVFGTTKSFIVADPSDSSRMIKYTSVEGPEAAIYVRGTANLVSGQGHIEFPDHFAVMAAPSSITVSLTPRSASSMGLAAVSVSSQGIDVAALGGGTNSYSFDYVAYAVRKGFEDYEVYLTQEQVVRLTGQAQAQALELRPRSLLTASPLKAIQRQE